MKKIILILIVLFSSFLCVNASTISDININIYVDNNGTAHVTETWVANVTEGTEGWHPYYNLGDAYISNVEVEMDNISFETIADWNESDSFSSKSYKAGLYYPSSDEVDVVFGISSYGRHTYVIKYDITGFVVGLNDSDIIYFNLFPYDFSAAPDNVKIKIYSDFRYKDTLDVWGYGKYGAPCYVYDGVIEMSSEEPLYSSDYMTILVKFEKGTFNTSHIIDNEFDYYYNMAEEGAMNYTGATSNNSSDDGLWGTLGALFSIAVNIFVWGGFLVSAGHYSKKTNNIRFGKTGNKVRKDVPNFRDIPCNGDIYRAYWIANKYNLAKKKEDFLGAIILKWLKEDVIRLEKDTTKKLFKEKEETVIVFSKRPDTSIELEVKLYDYMHEASGDGRLESNEFKKWCKDHYSKILDWFDKILKYELNELIAEGKITKGQEGKWNKYTVYNVDPSMMDEASQLAGLKKFLKEFSSINTREPIEVKLWNEYLMFAQIFGMAEVVAKQFKKLYPEIISDMESYGYDLDDILFIHYIYTRARDYP